MSSSSYPLVCPSFFPPLPSSPLTSSVGYLVITRSIEILYNFILFTFLSAWTQSQAFVC